MAQQMKGLLLASILLLAFALPAAAADNVTEVTKDTVQSISRQTASVSAQNTVTSITARSSMVLGLGGGGFSTPGSRSKGVSSGNNDNGIGLWTMGNYYYLDKSGSGKYDGDLYMVTGGVDKRFDRLLLGLSFGGEWLDLGLQNGGKYDSKGFTLAPYASYLLADDLMLDFSVGYTWLNNDLEIKADDGGGMQKYNDDYDSWRVYTAGGITKMWNYDAWRFSGRLGALYLHQSDDGFSLKGNTIIDNVDVSKSKYDLFQMQLGGRVGYDFGNVTPFVGVTYYQDIAKSGPDKDMVGADLDLGLNWKTGPMTIGVTGTYGIREDFQKVGGMLNFRFDF